MSIPLVPHRRYSGHHRPPEDPSVPLRLLDGDPGHGGPFCRQAPPEKPGHDCGQYLKDPGAGFGVDTNLVTFLTPDGAVRQLPLMSKEAVAGAILDEILSRRGR